MLDRLELHSGPMLHCSRRQHRLLQQAEQFLTASYQTASKQRKNPIMPAGAVYPRQTATHTPRALHTQMHPKSSTIGICLQAALLPLWRHNCRPPSPRDTAGPPRTGPIKPTAGTRALRTNRPNQTNNRPHTQPPTATFLAWQTYRHTNSPARLCA
jgi:hypothetical protein